MNGPASRLGQRIADAVRADGPLSVHDYMAMCLFDPQDGYYTTREPFGAAGDFTTAPEISQMFGELVAVWLVSAWQKLDMPAAPVLAEIGPGRGTLMSDILRTLGRIAPGLRSSSSVAMVEVSPRLAQVQKATLGENAAAASWHADIATLPEGPLFIVGNELFDAVPLRQYVRAGRRWHERAVALDEAGRLRFAAGAGSLHPSLLPPGAARAPEGAIVEIAPARAALMTRIARRIAKSGGAGLFFDYGYFMPGLGDTLQAVSRHRPDDVLRAPGEADLTAHVDFLALAKAAKAAGLDAYLATQGAFLVGMGLRERAGSLGAHAAEDVRERLTGEVERLAGPKAMGDLFKVLVLAPRGVVLPPFRPEITAE